MTVNFFASLVLFSIFFVALYSVRVFVLALFYFLFFSYVLFFIVFFLLFWKLTGDLAFASGSVSLLVEQCGVLGAKNLSTLVNGSDEGNPAAAEAFVEQVAELLCPNDCTLNGNSLGLGIHSFWLFDVHLSETGNLQVFRWTHFCRSWTSP